MDLEKQLQFKYNKLKYELTANSFFNNAIFTSKNMISLEKRNKNFTNFSAYIQNKIFQLEKDKLDEKDDIYFDFLWYAFQFATQQKFTIEQNSTFFSILHFLLVESLAKKMVATEVHDLLKIIIANHTVQCEPFTIEIFTPDQGKEILKFFRNTFLKYYSLWEIALTKFIDYNIFSQEKFEIHLPKLAPLKNGKEIDASEILELQYLYQKSNDLEDSEQQQNETDELMQSDDNQVESPQNQEIKKKQRDRSDSEIMLESKLQNTIAQFQVQMSTKLQENEVAINEEIQAYLAAKDPKKKK